MVDRNPRLIGNGLQHVKDNGGNYFVHLYNGLLKSTYALAIAVIGLIHAVFPFLFPDIPDFILELLVNKHELDSMDVDELWGYEEIDFEPIDFDIDYEINDDGYIVEVLNQTAL